MPPVALSQTLLGIRLLQGAELDMVLSAVENNSSYTLVFIAILLSIQITD